MAKGPIIIHFQGQGTCNLVHYPLQDTLTAINDTQRQNYNRALICKGVSDDGDEELLRSDNYKRLFPWYKTLETTVIQPTAASKLPPNLSPAQQQQVQAQKQAYDAQVAASQIAPPSAQKADASKSSQSELIHYPSAKNCSAIRLQSHSHYSPWVEPPLAYDNLLKPVVTTYQSGQLGPTTDSRSRQAHHQARTRSY